MTLDTLFILLTSDSRKPCSTLLLERTVGQAQQRLLGMIFIFFFFFASKAGDQRKERIRAHYTPPNQLLLWGGNIVQHVQWAVLEESRPL